MGEVEVEGWSFQVSVRNRNLFFDSVQNLKVSGEKRMILGSGCCPVEGRPLVEGK